MEIAVKETYAHMLKDESLVQNSEKIYIVEFIFDQSWGRGLRDQRQHQDRWCGDSCLHSPHHLCCCRRL